MSSSATSTININTAADWTQYLHRRVMRLLLHYDQRLFQGRFHVFYTQSTESNVPLLQLYDSYLRLLLLKDELLDDIIPRIKRQLSLQTNYILTQEDAPVRGEIDWPRTINRTLNETPDLLPIRFDTHEQRRSMATPENLFAVTILLNYQQAIQNIRKTDLSDESLNNQEQQQLIDIEEHIERELAAPYLQILIAEAKKLEMEQLADQVRKRLSPGESVYRDLYHWWEQFSALRIGKATGMYQLTLLHKRSDEKNNAQIYDLWITLEMLHLLTEKQSLLPSNVKIEKNRTQIGFTWNERNFLFTYNSQLLEENETTAGWQNIPGTTPRYTITREKPLEISSQQNTLWREPPAILTSSYEHAGRTGNLGYVTALQKLLGEMKLKGTRHAVLFTPILTSHIDGTSYPKVQRLSSAYTEGMSYNLADPNIRLCKLTPGMEMRVLQETLQMLLDDLLSKETFPEPIEPACHGIMLDEDTINVSRSRPDGYNILCPKPHIGEGVFDLVNDKIHCLKDPTVCHIYGQTKLAPFVIRAVTSDAMKQQSSDIRAKAEQTLSHAENAGDEDKAEQLRSHIFLGVGRAVEQYVKVRGNTSTLEAYFEEWIFGEYWKAHSRCLAEETRNILLSGAYVWDEYKQTMLNDWAAPAIQYCRALETEIKRRLHNHYPKSKDYYSDVGQTGFDVPRDSMTLGAVEVIYTYKDQDLTLADAKDRGKIQSAKHNWQLCRAIVMNSGSGPKDFEDVLRTMVNGHVSANRNQLAHGGPISFNIAHELRNTIIGSKGKPGLLCWLAEHLDPKI